jgi:hypothetical protein
MNTAHEEIENSQVLQTPQWPYVAPLRWPRVTYDEHGRQVMQGIVTIRFLQEISPNAHDK